MRTPETDDGALSGQRWIFVEDSEFLPAHGGGEREHLGMLEAARDAGILAAVVLPVSGKLDQDDYEAVLGSAPLIQMRRKLSPLRLFHPRHPYTVASRLPPSDLVTRVRAAAPDATGVVVTSYKSWAIGRSLAVGLNLPAVLRMHNREGAYHRSLASGTPGLRGLLLRWEAMRIDREERRMGAAEWLNGVADISRSDARWRQTVGHGKTIHVPPFAVRLNQTDVQRLPDPQPRVLFIGALDVATNVDAARWILEEVWPRVLARSLSVHLQIVGRAPSDDLRRRARAVANVEMHADVPEVQPFLQAARVAVNPAVSGSGVNIKLVEYLAAGIPVVSTSYATRGLDLVDGQDLVVVDDPNGFADAICHLLSHPDEAASMGRRGKETICALLDERANLERVARLLQPVGR